MGAPRGARSDGPLRRLLSLSRRHRRAFALATVLSLVSVACGLAVPVFTQRLIDDGIVAGDTSLVWPLSLGALGLGLGQALTVFWRRNLGHRTSIAIETELRSRLFAHLQGLPLSFHDRWPTGQLLARATSDLNAVSGFFGNALVFLTSFSITFLGVAIVLFVLDPLLALVTFGLTVPFTLAARHFNLRMRSVAVRSRQHMGEVTAAMEESVGGMRVLKGLGRHDRAGESVATAAGKLREANLEAVAVRSSYLPTLTLVPALIVAAVLGLGGTHVIHGRLSLGSLVAFSQYLALVLSPLRVAGWHLASAQVAVAAGTRILEVLDTEPELADAAGAKPLAPVEGHLVFEHVDVVFPGARTPALADVSFHARPGQTLALVGASGTGKSTIAAMAIRFVDPSAGRVLLDGVDLRLATLASLRRQVVVVSDDAALLRGTVADNIAFGDPDAGPEAIREAARRAGADEFIQALPHGYDSLIGDQGFALSGGQRQRLALARALLTQPRVLVLDDALSNVDVATAAAIEARLSATRVGRTTVVATRRAATAAGAGQVLFLDGGHVVARGTHQELLAHAGYQRVLVAGPAPEVQVDFQAAVGAAPEESRP